MSDSVNRAVILSYIDYVRMTGLGKKKSLEYIRKYVEHLPSERKTGHWVSVGGYCTPGGDPVWKCSECGKGMHVYGIEHGTYGADVSDGQWVACPNCGADMRGEEE